MSKHSPISFTPLGGGREIGANSYLIRTDAQQFVLDCGTHPKKDGVESLPDLSLLERAPDAVIISHAHVDHCGAVPYLVQQFPGTSVYATSATMGVMDRMLHNSVSVMRILARERNIEGYPLYSHEDVDFALRRTHAIELDQEFALHEYAESTACFRHAGHVLGSASVLLRLPGHTVFYTGDICVSDQELMTGLRPATDLGPVDTLVIESTYGANMHADAIGYEEQTERFCAAVTRVLARGGVALVPAFALGRTQEMLNVVARLQDAGELPDVPVYASGLGRAVYEVYHRFEDFLHPEAELQPLSRFSRVGDVWQNRVVQGLLKEPCIIVATSGMMIENTPSAMIAEEIVQREEHGIFFVGYLDPDTLGHKVLHSEPGAKLMFGPGRPAVRRVLTDIGHFNFSAHAPRSALHELIQHINPKNVVFVHGDPEAIDWLHEATGNGFRKFSPVAGETITLEA